MTPRPPLPIEYDRDCVPDNILVKTLNERAKDGWRVSHFAFDARRDFVIIYERELEGG